MFFRKYNHKLGSSFMEYAIMLGIVSLALVTMNTYIKRGVQGKVKDMTDYFIGREQVAEVSPTATTTSNSTRISQGTINSRGYIGGSTAIDISEETNISATSSTADTGKKPYVPDTSGAGAGTTVAAIKTVSYSDVNQAAQSAVPHYYSNE